MSKYEIASIFLMCFGALLLILFSQIHDGSTIAGWITFVLACVVAAGIVGFLFGEEFKR